VRVHSCTPFASRAASSQKIAIALLMSAFVLLSHSASAQATDALANLSPATRRTIQQLGSLNSIPADDWKFHAGDVAGKPVPPNLTRR
jgi:hypothetical protein